MKPIRLSGALGVFSRRPMADGGSTNANSNPKYNPVLRGMFGAGLSDAEDAALRKRMLDAINPSDDSYLGSVRDRIQELAGKAGDKAQGVADAVANRVQGVIDAVKQKKGELTWPEGVPFNLEDYRQEMRNTLQGYQSQAADFLPSRVRAFTTPEGRAQTAQTMFASLQDPANAVNLMGPGGMVGTFAGVGAKTADLAKLEQAKQMLKAGASDREAWAATGWTHAFPDGKPRFEISDDRAVFNTPEKLNAQFDSLMQRNKDIRDQLNAQGGSDLFPDQVASARDALKDELAKNWSKAAALSGNANAGISAPLVYEHPELYKAYPELANIQVKQGVYPENKRVLGYSQGPEIGIGQGALEMPTAPGEVFQPVSTMGHEMQHAVQGSEGFARGTMPAQAEYDMTNDLDQLHQLGQHYLQGRDPYQLMNKRNMFGGLDPEDEFALNKWQEVQDMKDQVVREAPMELYRRHAGEVEARLTQGRLQMTPEQRAASYPLDRMDVPPEQQIVRFDRTTANPDAKKGVAGVMSPPQPSLSVSSNKEGPAALNIGLNAGDVANGIKPIDQNAVLAAIKKNGGEVTGSTVHQSGTEPTLVATLKKPMSDDAMHQLALDTQQEAIPQLKANGEGKLHGPAAEKWGDFNPDYFLTPNGKPLSEAPITMDVNGQHFSREPHDVLSGTYFGRGAKSEESTRLSQSDDPRLLQRINAYVDEGKGVVPESDVGNVRHDVPMQGLYNIKDDPFNLRRQVYSDDPVKQANTMESKILDAGFPGYYAPQLLRNGDMGHAVLLGDASKNVKPAAVNGKVTSMSINPPSYPGPKPGEEWHEPPTPPYNPDLPVQFIIGNEKGSARVLGDVPEGARITNFSMAEPSMTEFEKAHATAQRNAAKPVSEGGLGLHPNNTAAERAAAMGYDPTELYHGSLFGDIKNIDLGGANIGGYGGAGFYLTPSAEDAGLNYASVYGPDVKVKIEDGVEGRPSFPSNTMKRFQYGDPTTFPTSSKDWYKGSATKELTPRQLEALVAGTHSGTGLGTVYPMMVDRGDEINLVHPERSARLGPGEIYDEATDTYQPGPDADKWRQIFDFHAQHGVEPNPSLFDKSMEGARYDEIWRDIADSGPEAYHPDTGEVYSPGGFASEALRNIGASSLTHPTNFGNPALNIAGEHTVMLTPTGIRSRNAAFDPARLTDPDILAGTIAAPVGVGVMSGDDNSQGYAEGGTVNKAHNFPDGGTAQLRDYKGDPQEYNIAPGSYSPTELADHLILQGAHAETALRAAGAHDHPLLNR